MSAVEMGKIYDKQILNYRLCYYTMSNSYIFHKTYYLDLLLQ